jgi:hypothetical protein
VLENNVAVFLFLLYLYSLYAENIQQIFYAYSGVSFVSFVHPEARLFFTNVPQTALIESQGFRHIYLGFEDYCCSLEIAHECLKHSLLERETDMECQIAFSWYKLQDWCTINGCILGCNMTLVCAALVRNERLKTFLLPACASVY